MALIEVIADLHFVWGTLRSIGLHIGPLKVKGLLVLGIVAGLNPKCIRHL